MNFNVKTIYGGTEYLSSSLSPQVRNIKHELKKVFFEKDIVGLKQIDIMLCFNGDVSSYFPTSGVYQPRYYKGSEKFLITFCFDKCEWTENEEDIDIFYKLFEEYLLSASVIVANKTSKYGKRMNKEIFDDEIKNYFNQMRI